MKKAAALLLACVCLPLTPLALAGYADDRAEIENLSARYMIAVDAGDIETVMATWADDGELIWVYGDEHGKAATARRCQDSEAPATWTSRKAPPHGPARTTRSSTT
jgi:hypothetical protein